MPLSKRRPRSRCVRGMPLGAMVALRLPLMPRGGVALPRSRAPRSTLRLRSRAAPARALALPRLRLVAPSRAPRLHTRVAAPLRAAAEDEAAAPARCAAFRAAVTAAPNTQQPRVSLTPRLLRACSAEAPAEAPPTPSPAPPKKPSKDSLEALPGQPLPLGPSPLGDDAVNFALWSKNAKAVTLCMCVRRRPSAPLLTAQSRSSHVAFGRSLPVRFAPAASWTRPPRRRPRSSR